jgi:nucleotide sugar dehydrogenase
VVVTKSTVPVGSGDWLAMQLEPARVRGWRGAIVSNPEFLREGSAVEDFLHPDRVVLGGEPEHVAVVESLYAGTTVSVAATFRMDRASAELVKYGANAALAAKISFANELADLCERTGADARLVLPAVGADPRIGPAFLEPGLGWGGSCLPKDVSALIASGAETGYDMALLRAAADVNDRRIEEVAQKLRAGLIRLAGRRVAVLGVAFKAGTGDTRDSPSIALIERLRRAGASVLAFDPLVRDRPDLPLTNDAVSALAEADAVVVATRDPAFERLDPAVAARAMRGRLVVDATGVLPAEAFADVGFQVVGAGWFQDPATPLARTA